MDSKGDMAERLFTKYSRLLLKIANDITDDPHLAEEAVSDTFEKVLKRKKKIDESNERRTGGLLIVMCKQSVAKLYKQKCQSVGVLMSEPPEKMTELDEVLEEILQKESSTDIRKQLSWMDPKYLDPLVMYYADEIPVPVISQRLGISENNVYTRLHRAKAILRKRYKNGGMLL